jgi:hypothetical protein
MFSYTPMGQVRLLRLPMGLVILLDVFQERMHNIMHDLEKVFSYLDDLACIDGGSFDDHYKLVDEVLTRLGKAGLKCKMQHWQQLLMTRQVMRLFTGPILLELQETSQGWLN